MLVELGDKALLGRFYELAKMLTGNLGSIRCCRLGSRDKR